MNEAERKVFMFMTKVRSMRKWLAVPPLLLSFSLLITACASGTQSTTPTAPASQPAAPGSATQPPAAASPEPIEIKDLKVSTSVRGPGYIPMYVADAKGFWKDEGLNIEMVYFRSGEQNTLAVQGGTIHIGGGAWTEPLNFYVAKQPFKSFFGVNNFPVYRWYAGPGVKSLDDLKGKQVRAAVSGVGTLTHIIMQWGLRKAGFADDKVKYVSSGSSAERAAALQSGQVDLITADYPSSYILDERGFNMVMDMAQLSGEFGKECFYAKEDFIANNPGTIKAFLRGYIRGIQYMKANQQETANILAEVMGTKPEDLPHVVKAVGLLINSFPEDGYVPEKGVQFMIDYYEEIGRVGKGLTYRDLHDNRYVEYFKANPVK